MMKKISVFLALAITVSIYAVAKSQSAAAGNGHGHLQAVRWPDGTKPFAQATLTPKSGSSVTGTVDFAKASDGLLVRAYLAHLKPGKHGIHVHEKGDCSAPDASSAGGHYNPTGGIHEGPMGAMRHEGDLGNIIADRDGNARLEEKVKNLSSPAFRGWSDIVGRSVVVHADADDYVTQPAGNSGARVACGTIRPVSSVSE
jgi:superoxide dismutase, Cu-Zn family